MEIYENLFQGEASEKAPEAPEFLPFRPLNDLVLVRRYEQDNSKAGSFIIPEKFRQQSNKGVVVASSPLVSYVEPGDLVTFGVYNSELMLVDGVEMLLIRENDIRGVERKA